MGWATKDGAYIYATSVIKLDCSKCGVVEISKYPKNDREVVDMIRAHAREHGGVDRG